MRIRVPEGATPLDDLSGLLLPEIRTYGDLCVAEAENILLAAGKYLARRRYRIGEPLIRRVHREMFQEVWDWAGRYRMSQTNLGVPATHIREEIAKLCGDIAFWDERTDAPPILERAARIHHRLAWIHPFVNGNGRHARFVADMYLFFHRAPRPIWPDTKFTGNSKARSRYLSVMRAADEGDFQPLVEFTENLIKRRA